MARSAWVEAASCRSAGGIASSLLPKPKKLKHPPKARRNGANSAKRKTTRIEFIPCPLAPEEEDRWFALSSRCNRGADLKNPIPKFHAPDSPWPHRGSLAV